MNEILRSQLVTVTVRDHVAACDICGFTVRLGRDANYSARMAWSFMDGHMEKHVSERFDAVG